MRMFVPKALRTEILEQCHEKMGHMGIDKTHELIGRRYYWPKLYAEVAAYVGSCRVCQTQSRRQIGSLNGNRYTQLSFQESKYGHIRSVW